MTSRSEDKTKISGLPITGSTTGIVDVEQLNEEQKEQIEQSSLLSKFGLFIINKQWKTIQDLIGDNPSWLEMISGHIPTRKLAGYHREADGGGGNIFWDANKAKSAHNGGTVFDPDWQNGNVGDANDPNWYQADPNNTGKGCWIRPETMFVTSRQFGVIEGLDDNDMSYAINAALDAPGIRKVIINNHRIQIKHSIEIHKTGFSLVGISSPWRRNSGDIFYKGAVGGAAIRVMSSYVDVENLMIRTGASWDTYQNYVGLEIYDSHSREYIHKIKVESADIGIHINAITGIFQSIIHKPRCESCNVGIKYSGHAQAVAVTAPFIYSGGVGIMSDNDIDGSMIENTIDFTGGEVGGNSECNVLLKKGKFCLIGTSWSEAKSPTKGANFITTGGVHTVDTDIANFAYDTDMMPFKEDGGHFVFNAPNQMLGNIVRKTINMEDAKLWYRFNKGSGETVYNRSPYGDNLHKYSGTSQWINGDLNRTVLDLTQGEFRLTEGLDVIDLTKDFTIIMSYKNTAASGHENIVEFWDGSHYFQLISENYGIAFQYAHRGAKGLKTNPPLGSMSKGVQWVILSYDANKEAISGWNESGSRHHYDYTQPFDPPSSLSSLQRFVRFKQAVFGDFILFDHALDHHQTTQICNNKTLDLSKRYAVTAPTTGNWEIGDKLYNSQPSSTEHIGTVCTEAGNPGTWKGFGLIEA
jgi:hypothetical protein